MDSADNRLDDSYNVQFKNFSTPVQKIQFSASSSMSNRQFEKKSSTLNRRCKKIKSLISRTNVIHDISEEEECSQDFLPNNQSEFIINNSLQMNDSNIVNNIKDQNVCSIDLECDKYLENGFHFRKYNSLSGLCNKEQHNDQLKNNECNHEGNMSCLFDISDLHDQINSSSIFEAAITSISAINTKQTIEQSELDKVDVLENHLNESTVNQLCASDDDLKQPEDVMDTSDFEKSIFQNNLKINENVQSVNKTGLNTNIFRDPFFGLPYSVKKLMEQYRGITDLYEWQKECLQLPAVDKRQNLIYALPTSGGKTLVAEILMLREIVCRKKNVLFVLPFVAIVQEKVWNLSPFAINLNFLIEEYAAGKGTFPPKKRRKKKSIYIATLEKALGIVRSLLEVNRLDELGLVVVDELHLIGDPSRGHILETMLTNIIFTKADIQIIGMSATIGNIDELATFIRAHVYQRNFRPVELKEYIKVNDCLYTVNYGNEELFTLEKNISFGYSSQVAKIDPDHLGGLVMEVIPNSSCLIFCPTKKNCENVAELLCKVVFKNLLDYKIEEKQALLKSLKYDSGGNVCPILMQTILWGIAYHHSGLTSEDRKLLEEAFRSGILSVLCCTSTLAAGVNLPAQRVILRSPIIGRDFLSLSTYKQMVGRAGRTGFACSGESIIICSNAHLSKLKELLSSPMDQAVSALQDNEASQLKMLFLNAIVLGLANNKQSLSELLKCTLFGVQADRLKVDLSEMTETTIDGLLKNKAILYMYETLKEEGLENKKLQVTKLGKAAIKGCIDLQKAHHLYTDLKNALKGLVLTGMLHLLYLVVPYDLAMSIQPDMSSYYPILIDLDDEGCDIARQVGIRQSFAINMATGAKPQGVPELVLNRFYIALMLRDLWNQMSVTAVSNRYRVNKGTVQSIMTSAASFSSNVLRFCEEFEEFWAFQDIFVNFTKRLAYCCTVELLPLMDLPSVKKGRAMQLYKAGYKTLQLIAKANVQDLTESIDNLPRNTARQIIDTAKLLLIEKIENLKDEAEDVLEDLGIKTV